MSWGVVFFVLLGLGLAVGWLGWRTRAATGLPAGRPVYVDTTRWRPVEQPLFSPAYRLAGRPDYLVRHRRDLIPVEVKSGPAPAGGPYPSHVLQLAVYCLLVHETYDRCPPHGIVLYTDDAHQARQAYQIDYTPALEDELLDVLEEMDWALAEGDAPRDHDQAVRCRACSYRYACDQALA